VKRAGETMRVYMEGESRPLVHELRDAVNTITEFRRLHASPLQKVTANLRYYIIKHTDSRPITVGQRLKRFPTIVDKLCRHPDMNLARMQDIGGCRAVVATEEEARAIFAHLKRRWAWRREYDYITDPKPDSGYRALHLVAEKDGRLIEVQLRTIRQHAWAELIELVDRRNPTFNLKSGSAPPDVVEYYRVGAALLASGERDEPADPDLLNRFRELHKKVAPQ
jgi:putative GTP pyrophosphokinase